MIKCRNVDGLFRLIVCLGVIIILGIAVIFVVRAIKSSRVKDFWRDETYGLEGTTRTATFKQLLTMGARGQGSAAPLDYIFIKCIDSVYHQKFFANIPHNIFYRLDSIFWDLIAGLLVAFLFLFFCSKTDNKIIIVQLILVCYSLWLFYFKREDMSFAIQMRPYALWNSLWFVMLSLVMLRSASIWLFLVGVFLALTSSGALIQIPILAFSQSLLRIIDREKFLNVLKETVLIFLLPFLIAIYYALHAGKFGYINSSLDYQRYAHEFFLFWMSKWRTLALSCVGILLTFGNRQFRGCTVVFLTIFLLYCAAPAINRKILSISFFFTSRQYLYYDLIYPLFFLMLALVLPEYWDLLLKLKNKWLK